MVGFWKKINQISIGGQRDSLIPLAVEVNGKIVTDVGKAIEKWKNDFSTIYSNPNNPIFDCDHLKHVESRMREIEEVRSAMPHENENSGPELLNSSLTLDEVRKGVYSLKNNKAAAFDSIPAECLKNEAVISILHKIYSYCFDKGIVPDSWLKGIIHPIFKQGSKYNPMNYRSVTLMNIICKCYSSILNKRLCNWIECNDILNDEQNGFRSSRSCLDHMYVLYTIIRNRLLVKRSTYACFIDARKAFDRVNHACLWYKLFNLGVRGKMLNALQSLYKNGVLMAAVRINNLMTDSFLIECSVKQGDPSSPTLFSLYMNDLITSINRVNEGIMCGNQAVSTLCYADDIVVFSETAKGLQKQLDVISGWCSTWRMEINQDKTKIVHFRPHSVALTNQVFKLSNCDIITTNKYKYLGLYFNEHLDTDEMVKDVAKSAVRALGGMITKYNQIGGNSYEIFTKLYQSLVEPVMLYGAALWGSKGYNKLNVIQNRACKYFLGVPRSTSNVACMGDMGWLSVEAKQHLEMVRFWCRLKNMNKDKLTYRIHQWSLSMSRRNIKTIEYSVKSMLKECQLLESASCNEGVCTKGILSDFRHYLNVREKDKWCNNVLNDHGNVNGSKLRLYRSYKKDILVETYVTTRMPFAHRKNLAMLRCGSLPIMVELGRRQKVPLGERLCTLCNNDIEDEVHLLLQCPIYDDLRQNVIGLLNPDLCFKDQFCSLMTNTNIQAVLGKLVFSIMQRRSGLVNI